MATMKYQDTQKLIRLGFHRGRTGDNWTRHFAASRDASTILLVRNTAVGYEYRTAVVNPTQDEGVEQWMDAKHTRRAIRSMRKSDRVWRKAQRALEGGVVRRAVRRVLW